MAAQNPVMETSVRVVIEFQRSSEPGVGRVIRFNHSAAHMPYQLKGRLSTGTWESIMSDMDLLAKEHPYVARPTAKDVGAWGLCALMGSVVGVCCMNPDAGNYDDWVEDVGRVVARYHRELEQGGCVMALERNVNYWIRIDIDPNVPMIEMDGPSPRRVKGDSSSYVSPFQSLPSDLKQLSSEEVAK